MEVVKEIPDPDMPRAKASETVTENVESENVIGESVNEVEVGVDETEEGVATSLDSLDVASEEVEQLVRVVKKIGPVSEGKDWDEFRDAVKEDESIKEWRELGDRGERNFMWKEGC